MGRNKLNHTDILLFHYVWPHLTSASAFYCTRCTGSDIDNTFLKTIVTWFHFEFRFLPSPAQPCFRLSQIVKEGRNPNMMPLMGVIGMGRWETGGNTRNQTWIINLRDQIGFCICIERKTISTVHLWCKIGFRIQTIYLFQQKYAFAGSLSSDLKHQIFRIKIADETRIRIRSTPKANSRG